MTDIGRKPLVSIIITSYNRARWIGDAIQSALHQDYENFEIIVSDNCSDDNTADVITPLLIDSRVKFFRNDINVGMLPNFKLAIETRATGDYFVILNSDDLLPDASFISKAVALVQQYPSANFVKGRCKNRYEATGREEDAAAGDLFGHEFRKGIDVFLGYSGKEDLSWAGILINRSIFNSLHVFDSNYTAIDVGSNLMLMLLGDVGFINEVCYTFRVHGSNAHIQTSAQHCINNFLMITKPYEMALAQGTIDKGQLDKWKHRFLMNLIKDNLTQLYIGKRDAYRQLRNYIIENYSNEYIELTNRIKWKLFLLLYAQPMIGKTFIKLIFRK
ncbi:glycosyltransferase family 2 protein [Chitinophaga sp.]|uniref:glycosyltransferase family 2 protein n=1 Tax=Chitinophaga sp. TaxID=1869181 RepID=UPI0031CF9F15